MMNWRRADLLFLRTCCTCSVSGVNQVSSCLSSVIICLCALFFQYFYLPIHLSIDPSNLQLIHSSHHQSINQSVNESMNQSINQSMNESINQSTINQSINQ